MAFPRLALKNRVVALTRLCATTHSRAEPAVSLAALSLLDGTYQAAIRQFSFSSTCHVFKNSEMKVVISGGGLGSMSCEIGSISAELEKVPIRHPLSR